METKVHVRKNARHLMGLAVTWTLPITMGKCGTNDNTNNFLLTLHHYRSIFAWMLVEHFAIDRLHRQVTYFASLLILHPFYSRFPPSPPLPPPSPALLNSEKASQLVFFYYSVLKPFLHIFILEFWIKKRNEVKNCTEDQGQQNINKRWLIQFNFFICFCWVFLGG